MNVWKNTIKIKYELKTIAHHKLIGIILFSSLLLTQLKFKISRQNPTHELESFTTSKMDRHLLWQKVHQKISVIKTNTFDDIEKNSSFWHFNSRFVLKTTKTQVFVMITEIFWWTFWRNKWRSIFDVVKDSS